MNDPAAPRYSRQYPILVSAVLVLVLCAGTASAHPPSEMTVSYNQLSADLSVTITHPVAGTKGHFIKDVTVTVNGNLVNDTTYTAQAGDTLTYTYPLALNPGDTVVVTATCSLAGTASRTFTMPGPTATEPTAEKAPLAAAASLAAIGAVAVLWRRA